MTAERSRVDRLREAVAHISHLLPAQGPIGVFIHHNTLHAFQHLPFEEAVAEAARVYGAEPYMTEAQYEEHFRTGRILWEDVVTVLDAEPNQPVAGLIDRRTLRRRILTENLRPPAGETLAWRLDEGDLAGEARQDPSLFDACLEIVESRDSSRNGEPVRSQAIADAIHPLLIRLSSIYFDQGVSYWTMANRENGFYRSCRRLLALGGGLMPKALDGLSQELRRQEAASLNAESAVLEMLDELGVPDERWLPFLQDELLSLAGWAGLFNRLEHEPQLAPHERLPFRLMDYLAMRLSIKMVAARNLAFVEESDDKTVAESARRLASAFYLYRTALASRIIPGAALQAIWTELDLFDQMERRRIWHLAYERRHEQMVLGPIARFRRENPPTGKRRRPEAQVFFCLDDREESIRRHLEEIAPTFETFGAAGFYGAAIDYKGIDDARGVNLCPVVVKPAHAVREIPHADDVEKAEQRTAIRRALGQLTQQKFLSSRTLVGGWISTALLGIFSLLPLITRLLAPRGYGKLRTALNRKFLPEPRTEITVERRDQTGHDMAEGLMLGFSETEKTDRVAGVLTQAGLTENFAPIVVVLGHGSTSLNNPHESAYDCGACGGRRGGPNGRIFAAMANLPNVRRALVERGVRIPDSTWFVGGYHDTGNDDIEIFDEELVPASHREKYARVRQTLDKARARNAHERSRRFESARLDETPEAAIRHVEERSEHLAEPRPECGHATNAITFVGRREVTRGLFLDRRIFLTSYDPFQDPTGDLLAALLSAVVPVCAGISLEYYFSYVDNEVYGAGTKLPHNVAGLIGVINGNSSDLRTGLPWQMVEIHEPVRSLFLLETTEAIFFRIFESSSMVREFVENRWVRMAIIDPVDGTIRVLSGGQFQIFTGGKDELPVVSSSLEWYRGHREHLPIAQIRPLRPAGQQKDAA